MYTDGGCMFIVSIYPSPSRLIRQSLLHVHSSALALFTPAILSGRMTSNRGITTLDI